MLEWQTDIHMERYKARQTDRKMDGQKNRYTYGWMVRPMDQQLDVDTDY